MPLEHSYAVHQLISSPPFQHRLEHQAVDRQAGRDVLLPGAEGPRVLRVGEDPEAGREPAPREAGLRGHVHRQVHQGQQVRAAHHRPHVPGPLRTVQALDQVLGRAAVPLRQPHHQVGTGQDHGQHAQVPGSGRVHDERRAHWIRGGGQVDGRVQVGGPGGHGLLPPGGHWRVH